MKKIKSLVGWLLIISILAFYLFGIIKAIIVSWPNSTLKPVNDYPEFLATSVGSIQNLLMANFGAALGISIMKTNSSIAKSLFFEELIRGKSNISPPKDFIEEIQILAIIVFIISLIACVITLALNDFNTDPEYIVSIISEGAKMFISTSIAYLATLLGVAIKISQENKGTTNT